MGCELALTYVPKAKLTEKRLNELKQTVASFSAENIEDWLLECYEDDADGVEQCRVDLRETVEELVDILANWRSTCSFRLEDCPYDVLFAGGDTWGDDPSETFTHLARLAGCPPLWNKLLAWAKEDRVNEQRDKSY